MAIAEVSIIPIGTKTPSLSGHLVQAFRGLEEEEDIKYELTPMGTIIEGDIDKVLGVVKMMHESAFGEEVLRVVTTVIIDDRRDKPLSMSSKVESLKKRLGH
jgi:uncharacterized protein (TIGR00106 family)